jgi:hypothetical protein
MPGIDVKIIHSSEKCFVTVEKIAYFGLFIIPFNPPSTL